MKLVVVSTVSVADIAIIGLMWECGEERFIWRGHDGCLATTPHTFVVYIYERSQASFVRNGLSYTVWLKCLLRTSYIPPYFSGRYGVRAPPRYP